jgi:hypothetical protein
MTKLHNFNNKISRFASNYCVVHGDKSDVHGDKSYVL